MPELPEALPHDGRPPTTTRSRGGPRSARGRRRSRLNATRHGLHARQVRFTPAEKGRFYRHVARLLTDFDRPDEPTRELARQAAHAMILLRRVEYARLTHPQGEMSAPALRLFFRHAPRYERQYFQAIARLLLLPRQSVPTPEVAGSEPADAQNEGPADFSGSSHP
jgi:hypothetical protein